MKKRTRLLPEALILFGPISVAVADHQGNRYAELAREVKSQLEGYRHQRSTALTRHLLERLGG